MAEEEVTGLEGNSHWSEAHEDITSNADLAKFASKFENPSAMAKSGYELEKKMGGSFRLPDDLKGLSEEQKADILSKTRTLRDIPEKAEDYEITIPEDIERDENFEGAFKELMHKHGRSKAEVQEVADFYHAALKAAEEVQAQADEKAANEAETNLRLEHGKDYDKFIENIGRVRLHVAQELGMTYKEGDEVRSKLDDALNAVDKNGRKMGNNPAFLNMMNYFYEKGIGEGVPVGGAGETGKAESSAFDFKDMD